MRAKVRVSCVFPTYFSTFYSFQIFAFEIFSFRIRTAILKKIIKYFQNVKYSKNI